jgi:hypothetical protein
MWSFDDFDFWKSSKKLILSQVSIKTRFLHLALGGGVKKNFFSDFFETTLEMFSVLKYIGQIKILAEKNYSGCFRQVRKFKKST